MAVATRWRTSAIRVQSVVVEVCWRPAPADGAGAFHEVVDLEDGRVAVVVGHASGGEEPAAVVDELRVLLRRIVRDEPDPAVVLARLDQVPALSGETTVTCACALIDPTSRAVRTASAGHPPVVLVDGVGAELLEPPDGIPLGVEATRIDLHRTMRSDTAMFLWTAGLLGSSEVPERAAVDTLVTTCCEGLTGASAWASEFARRASAQFGEPDGEAVVASIRLEPVSIPAPLLQLPTPQEPQWVTLRVFLDPADLRSRGLLRLLGRLTNLVRDVELHVELIDVTEQTDLTEANGVLATPTIVREGGTAPVRVTGWFDSARRLAKALQLPLDPTAVEEPA